MKTAFTLKEYLNNELEVRSLYSENYKTLLKNKICEWRDSISWIGTHHVINNNYWHVEKLELCLLEPT